MVFDISNPESLITCNKWLGGGKPPLILFFNDLTMDFLIGVRAMRPTGQRMLGALVANKCEFRDEGGLDSRAEVSLEEGQGVARELGIKYFETSAVSVVLYVVSGSLRVGNA